MKKKLEIRIFKSLISLIKQELKSKKKNTNQNRKREHESKDLTNKNIDTNNEVLERGELVEERVSARKRSHCLLFKIAEDHDLFKKFL